MTTSTRLPTLPQPSQQTKAHAGATAVSTRVSLPHFIRLNGDLDGAKASPRRRRPELDDNIKTPIAQAIQGIRHASAKIRASFDRMNQTEILFDEEVVETRALIEQAQAEQEAMTRAYFVFFNFSATQLQRVFRGHQARKIYRETLALRAILRIQRAFRANQSRRAERRRRFRILSRKILRGLKGIRARDNLTQNEILSRVSHNLMIERQWRMAMGVGDTENNLLHALYRRKFVRKRIATLLRSVVTVWGIVSYWRRLVALRKEFEEPVVIVAPVEVIDITLDLQDVFITTAEEDRVGGAAGSATRLDIFSVTQQLSCRTKQAKSTPKTGRVTREDLRQKQKMYTQKIYEENLKKEAVRAAQLEKQRETARLAEEARKQHDEEQRRLRMEQAQALRDDLDRRGLLAIKELQSKKEEEVRKEEEALQRVAQAKQRIAKEVLSDETQTLLIRRQKGTGAGR